MQPAKRKRKRRYAAPIGGLFILLALIGTATVIFSSIDLTFKMLDNSSTKSELEELIRPVMMFDPVPFENPADIEPAHMLLYSMWINITSEKRASYTYDESGSLRIPASDLDVAAAKLFGSDIVLEHQTFGDYAYYYDAENKVYNVPVSAELYDIYSPLVETIERGTGDLYNVTVGYIPPGGAWTTDFSGVRGQPAPEKYMLYVLRKIKSGYQIVALRDTESAAVALEPSVSSQPESEQTSAPESKIESALESEDESALESEDESALESESELESEDESAPESESELESEDESES